MINNQRVLGRNFIIIALLLTTFLILWPPYNFAFVGDDYVQFDHVALLVNAPAEAVQLLNPYYLTWYYRPLQNLWFLAGRLTVGYQPLPYYFTLGLTHLLVVALLWRVGRQLGLRPFPAFIATLLFAIHGHWVDVVGWNSAFAIVAAGGFTLAAISAWLAYLQRPARRHLLLTAVFFVLGILSHEEMFLLPPVLFAIWLWQRKILDPQSLLANLKTDRHATAFFTATAVFIPLYLFVQLDRPNITIDLTERGAIDFLSLIRPLPISQFISQSVMRLTTVNVGYEFFLTYSYAISWAVLVLLVVWAWKGGAFARIIILWVVSHLAFIYLTVYSSRPEFYAGRHIYNSWLALALGAGWLVQQVTVTLTTSKRGSQWRRPFTRWPLTRLQTAWLLLALLIAGAYALKVQQVQFLWLADATEELAAREQLFALLPEVTVDDHLFAARFPITPKFLRSVVQVWYDLPRLEQPYGPLSRLQDATRATSNYYVLDYANGRVYNLAPELQETDETFLIWALPASNSSSDNGPPTPNIAGPADDRRLSVDLDLAGSGEWLAYTTTPDVPVDTTLRFAVRAAGDAPPPGATTDVRLRLTGADGQTQTLWQETISLAETAVSRWQPVTVDVSEYWGQNVTLRLEARTHTAGAATVYWANPRLVR